MADIDKAKRDLDARPTQGTNWWDVFFVSLGIIVFITVSVLMFGLAMTEEIL